MKTFFQNVVYTLIAATAGLQSAALEWRGSNNGSEERNSAEINSDYDAAASAQPKLLTISGAIDGSGRIVFNRKTVRYEHRHWGRPRRLIFDGEPWTKLDQTPVAWQQIGRQLDLTKAWVAKRSGRDVIALEHTPDGFDLYLSDSPNGAAQYTVTIAIPRRN
jgi:hypothetical protein